MTEDECLTLMEPPSKFNPRNPHNGGAIQIHVTRACDKACFHCTQASNLGGKPVMITLEQFEQACLSLKGYPRTVGCFGGNPASHPQFEELCAIMRKHIPAEQRAIWCNNPLTPDKAKIMRATFHHFHSNLNVHGDQKAYDLFRTYWPEARVFGLHEESRHSPCFVSMKDLKKKCPACKGDGNTYVTLYDENNPSYRGTMGSKCKDCNGTGEVEAIPESERWRLISTCDINHTWSALVGVVPGKGLRAFFCEIAYTMAVLHADDPDWPDTGLQIPDDPQNWRYYVDQQGTHLYRGDPNNMSGVMWWQLPMTAFAAQVRRACHHCSVPLRGHGALSQATDAAEQVSPVHAANYISKTKGRRVELVTVPEQLGTPLGSMVEYVYNAATRPK